MHFLSKLKKILPSMNWSFRIFTLILIIPFRVFDKDKDGYLTMDDLRKFLTTLGDRMSDKEMGDMMKLLDKEKEGVVECEGKT